MSRSTRQKGSVVITAYVQPVLMDKVEFLKAKRSLSSASAVVVHAIELFSVIDAKSAEGCEIIARYRDGREVQIIVV